MSLDDYNSDKNLNITIDGVQVDLGNYGWQVPFAIRTLMADIAGAGLGETELVATSTDTTKLVSGGTDDTDGASITLYGGTHATDDKKATLRAKDFEFTAVGGAVRGWWDEEGLRIGSGLAEAKLDVDGAIAITDGMTAPSTASGKALIYVDSADGDLKVKFGDGTVKTIATDA